MCPKSHIENGKAYEFISGQHPNYMRRFKKKAQKQHHKGLGPKWLTCILGLEQQEWIIIEDNNKKLEQSCSKELMIMC